MMHLVRETPQRPEPISDEALLTAVATGDRQAFSQFVRRYEGQIRGFCSGVLRDPEEARETAQEVFLKLWEHRSRYQMGSAVRPYLYTIARNLCRSKMRRRKVLSWVGLESAPEARDAAASVDQLIGGHQDTRLVQEALKRLPDKFRVPLALRMIEDMPYEEIAEVIGRTPSAARSRVHYGLKQLAALLPEEVRP